MLIMDLWDWPWSSCGSQDNVSCTFIRFFLYYLQWPQWLMITLNIPTEFDQETT